MSLLGVGRTTSLRRLDRWRRAAPLLGVGLLGLAWAAPAAAQEEEGGGGHVVLRAVDATSTDVVLYVSASGGGDAVSGITVRENDEEVDVDVASLADAGKSADVVFVVDTSVTTDANALLASARTALEDLVADLPDGARVAVVSAGNASQTLRGLTDDAGRLGDALEDLTPGGEGALLSGLVRGANLVDAGQDSDRIPSVVLVTDGVEESNTAVESATTALVEAGAPLFVVGLPDEGFDEGLFRSLAEDTGGRLVVAQSASEVEDALAAIGDEAFDVGAVTFESSADEGVQDLELTVDGTTIEASYISGSYLAGAHRLAPRPPVDSGGIEFLQGDLGRLIGFGAALIACILFAYAVILLFTREKTALSQALQPYADGFVAPGSEDDEGGGSSFTSTAFMQRAVELTEQFAERQGILARLENRLERADLPLRAGEALFFYLAGMVLVLVAVVVLSQNLMATLVVGLLVALIPPAALNILATRKKKSFEALLPDTLQLLSSTLRAGYSMMQGVEAVSQEAAEPMGKELRRVVTEARLGRPLEESLESVAERMSSPDFGWAVMAIRIQREVGGNLSELLMTVAETMTERERLRRDINSLTAEGRISAYVLIGLPIGLGLFLWSVNPDYLGQLFDHSLGQVMLGAAVLAMVAGYAWMMKIIKIEI